jgi:Tol biopolymer transport system component
MRARAFALVLLFALTAAGCTGSSGSRDPGKVLLPVKPVSVQGRLYATKSRTLYRFAGSRVTTMLAGTRVKDPALTVDGLTLALAHLQAQSSTIAMGDASGRDRHDLTPSAEPEGALWAFSPSLSDDGRRILFVSDRGKPPSSPQNLQPNDLGVWLYDSATGGSRRLTDPMPYTGGDADPVFRPGDNDQFVYTTYLYAGTPAQSVARLAWRSINTGRTVYLTPDSGRSFQPAFSPDGRFLAFIRAESGEDNLYIMPLPADLGRRQQPPAAMPALLVQSGVIAQPVWSPNGKAIAFLMLTGGNFDLYILPLISSDTIRAGGPPQAVTHGSFLDADSRLAWSG